MEFVLWASKTVHVLSAAVWLGGLVYYNAVLSPVLQYEGRSRESWLRAVERRFQGFVWSVAIPVFLTGALLLAFQPRLAGIALDDVWTWMMATKVVMLVLMGFFSWQSIIVIGHMEKAANADEESFEGWFLAFQKLVRRGIFCGIVATLAASSLAFV